jgi:hypothetical protein
MVKFRFPKPHFSKAGVKSWLWLWTQVSMLAVLAMMSNFLSNRFEVSAQDLVLPVVLNLLTAAIVTAVFYRAWRRQRLVGLLGAGLAILAITNGYDDRLASVLPTIQALLPLPNLGWFGQVLGSLLLLGFILGAAYGAGRGLAWVVGRRHWRDREIAGAMTVTIVATFALQLLPLARDLVVEWPQFFYKPPKLAAAPSAAKVAAKPDIYYIVLDRYASDDVLKQQFGYDDSDFLNFLTSNDYYVNPSAHNNYPYTTMSIASTMQADYLNDSIGKFSSSSRQTIIPFNETIRNSPVAQHLQSLGYKYDLIGNWYETSNLSEVANQTYQQTGRLTLLGWNITLDNFSKNILTQSPLWRFIQPGLHIGNFAVFSYVNLGDIDMTHYALQSLRNEVTAPAGGRFIYAHILVPHDPYYFNADGSLSTTFGSDNIGAPIKQKYLGQVQYINGQMKDILGKINAASKGKAVVVLQADEGPYPFQLNDEVFDQANVDDELQAGDMRGWSTANLQMKFGNLAAYHVPAADLADDAVAKSAADSVNIFRLVLNSYFGEGLPYLPDCYYAYPNGRDEPLVFADITSRLTGQPGDARCSSDGSVK